MSKRATSETSVMQRPWNGAWKNYDIKIWHNCPCNAHYFLCLPDPLVKVTGKGIWHICALYSSGQAGRWQRSALLEFTGVWQHLLKRTRKRELIWGLCCGLELPFRLFAAVKPNADWMSSPFVSECCRGCRSALRDKRSFSAVEGWSLCLMVVCLLTFDLLHRATFWRALWSGGRAFHCAFTHTPYRILLHWKGSPEEHFWTGAKGQVSVFVNVNGTIGHIYSRPSFTFYQSVFTVFKGHLHSAGSLNVNPHCSCLLSLLHLEMQLYADGWRRSGEAPM